MKKYLALLGFIFLVGFAFAFFSAVLYKGESKNSKEVLAQHFNMQWAMDPLWEDGLAEVNIYEADRVIYGENRNFDYVYITVKEEFNEEYRVKTDDYQQEDLYSVMKINQFARIPTDNYPYHFLTSVFLKREEPLTLHKMTTSSQEWCGNTFKEFLEERNYYQFIYHSYWDGQGDGALQIDNEVLFEDQLTYTLRSLQFEKTPSFDCSIYETQKSSKATEPHKYEASVQVTDESYTEWENPTWKVTVELEEGKNNEYWFEKAYPNKLIRQTTWDGRDLMLKETKREAYWQHRQ